MFQVFPAARSIVQISGRSLIAFWRAIPRLEATIFLVMVIVASLHGN